MSRSPLQTLRTLSPNCRDAAQLISQAMERDLARTERVGLVLHLAICRACRNYRQGVRFLHSALWFAASRQLLVSSETLSDAAKERIRQRLVHL